MYEKRCTGRSSCGPYTIRSATAPVPEGEENHKATATGDGVSPRGYIR
jgi:hypothetical protein